MSIPYPDENPFEEFERISYEGSREVPIMQDVEGVIFDEKDKIFVNNVEIIEDLLVYGSLLVGELINVPEMVVEEDLDVGGNVLIEGNLTVDDRITTDEIAVAQILTAENGLLLIGSTLLDPYILIDNTLNTLELNGPGGINLDNDVDIEGELSTNSIIPHSGNTVTIGIGNEFVFNQSTNLATFASQVLLSSYSDNQYIAQKTGFTPNNPALAVLNTYDSRGTDGTNTTNPNWGTFNNGTGRMTLTKSGTYLVSISGSTTQNEAGWIFFAISINGTVPDKKDFREITPGIALDFEHTFFTTQLSGTTVEVRASSLAVDGSSVGVMLATFIVTMTKVV